MESFNWLLRRSRINFSKIVNLIKYIEVTKNRKLILMVRLILLITFILLVAWILQPFLRTKSGNKTKTIVDRLPDSDKSNFRQKNTGLIIITTLILLTLVVWLLPKLGINFIALLQKIIPIASSLRGILPF